MVCATQRVLLAQGLLALNSEIFGDIKDAIDDARDELGSRVEVDLLVHVVGASVDEDDVGTSLHGLLPVVLDVAEVLAAVALVVIILHLAIAKGPDHVHRGAKLGELVRRGPL